MKKILLFSALVAFFYSCTDKFLDLKRDKKQVIPTTLRDYQAILDHFSKMNSGTTFAAGEIGTDDYFVSNERWQALTNLWEKNAYVWSPDIFEGSQSEVWNLAYEKVLYANFVLDGLAGMVQLDSGERLQRDAIKGAALFFRGYTFFQLAQLFCDDFDPSTAETDPGVVLKLTSDINERIGRASVSETYQRIILDLEESINLLPDHIDINAFPTGAYTTKSRPTRAVAVALLARVFLQMGNYEKALAYSNEFLQLNNQLMDFNQLDTANYYTMPFLGEDNPEMLFVDMSMYSDILMDGRCQVDTVLYGMYEKNDLRTKLYFIENEGIVTFRGSYNGDLFLSGSPTTSEVYLIRMECNARLGKVPETLADLNLLLRKRYSSSVPFPEITISEPLLLLTRILEERRKELLFRGVRWSDLRRLNRDPRFAKTLVRKLGGRIYEIAPGSNLYTWPIPDNEIQMSGIEQNPRDE